jgi:hypothetical protein
MFDRIGGSLELMAERKAKDLNISQLIQPPTSDPR